MTKTNFTKSGDIVAEYNFGATRVIIRDHDNAYARLPEHEKKNRDDDIGAMVLRLLEEIES